jgi:NodT family efflux transporter outer membrane factor (OMF) lipoprotein
MTSRDFIRSPIRHNGKRIFIAAALLAFILTHFACAHMVEPEHAQLGMELPDTYSLYEEAVPAPDRWWEGFGSEELNLLVTETLRGSPTLRASLARLEQARALAVQAGAERSPDLDLRAGASETRRRTGGQIVSDSSRNLTLVSSWELDFWGRMRAEHRSALLETEASREGLYSAALTLSSEVTLTWLEIISVRRQLALFKEQLETNRTILELIELRYLKGLANVLDIYQQRQVVAEIEAGFPQLEAQLQTLYHEIAVLSGKPPRAEMGLTADSFPEITAQPGAGIPADLLSKRPDVRAAGLKLRVAESEVTAARADRLPAVNLSATAGFSSDSFSDLLEKWLTTLAANLTWPLFNAGSMDAAVTRNERIVEERLASYEQTVLNAIREVEDSMVREFKQTAYIEALNEQLLISRDGFREAVSRYRKGLSDYLPVLSALTSTQRLERSIVQARLERLSQRVKLHRALGGGWMEEEFKSEIGN